MKEFKSIDGFSGTIEFSSDSWSRLMKLMDDLDVSKTPSFTLSDKYGNKATYVRTCLQPAKEAQ